MHASRQPFRLGSRAQNPRRLKPKCLTQSSPVIRDEVRARPDGEIPSSGRKSEIALKISASRTSAPPLLVTSPSYSPILEKSDGVAESRNLISWF